MIILPWALLPLPFARPPLSSISSDQSFLMASTPNVALLRKEAVYPGLLICRLNSSSHSGSTDNDQDRDGASNLGHSPFDRG